VGAEGGEGGEGGEGVGEGAREGVALLVGDENERREREGEREKGRERERGGEGERGREERRRVDKPPEH